MLEGGGGRVMRGVARWPLPASAVAGFGPSAALFPRTASRGILAESSYPVLPMRVRVVAGLL